MNFRPVLGTFLGVSMLILLPAPAGAGEIRDDAKAVVELFTSQGCSSCPPADAVFSELAKTDGVVALAYHVDYWDYIGWSDTFGDEANSDHQRAYAESWGSGRIYTPQLIVNGKDDAVGSRRKDVQALLQQARLDLPVKLMTKGDMLKVDIPPREGQAPSLVWLVTYLGKADVAIERGENQGHTIAYANVVVERQLLGMWEPETGAQFKLPISEVLTDSATGAAILVQDETEGLPGPIRGAAAFQK